MRYLADNMFNGLAKQLSEAGIECDTAIHAIWGDRDSSKKGRHDAIIFRFLLEKKFKLIPLNGADASYKIITADKDLARYCDEFKLECEFISRDRAPTKAESKELAEKIISKESKLS
jgi:hypothetical protein